LFILGIVEILKDNLFIMNHLNKVRKEHLLQILNRQPILLLNKESSQNQINSQLDQKVKRRNLN